jgi:ribonuclease BN (tRNA processing enzyme)
MASSVLLELGELKLVFDFGRGVAQRLAGLGLTQDDIGHVVLSHFHADHWSDLIPYLQAGSWSRIDPRTRDLNVWGPAGLGRFIGGMLELFPPDDLVRRDRFDVRLHELPAGPFRIAGTALELRPLPPAGNHGLRFEHRGRLYAFTGDSAFHEQAVAFVRGAELAVIDAGHPSEDEIVRLAVEGGARTVVCSHLYAELDGDRLAERARAAGFAGRLLVARDLQHFDL